MATLPTISGLAAELPPSGAQPSSNVERSDTGSDAASSVSGSPARIFLGLGCALFLIALYRHRAFLHDDALISLRFARNFVDHGALEWNLGERVEGYTNFLHLLLTAGLMKLGFDPVASVRAINFAAAAGLFWITWQALRTLLPTPGNAPLRMTGFLLVVAAPSIPLWIFGGLETVMTATLLTAGVAYLLPALVDGNQSASRPVLAGLMFAAAILTRPDAAVAAAAFLGMMVLVGANGRFIDRLRLPFIAGLAMALPVLLHVAWRFHYYGDIVPNTFYAKVGVPLDLRLHNGMLYLWRSHAMLPALFASLALLILLPRTIPVPRVAWALLVSVTAHVVYTVWAGGDHMAGARLLLPVVSLAAFLAVVLVEAMPGSSRKTAMLVLAAAAVFINLRFPGQEMDRSAFAGRIVGEHLARTEKPGALIATATAGSIPYYAGHLRFIDTLGLVDRKIAMRREFPILTRPQMTMPGHTKGDGAYVLERRPDIFILGPDVGADTESQIHFLSDREAVNLPEFERCYRKHQDALPYDRTVMWGRDDLPNPLLFTYYRRHC